MNTAAKPIGVPGEPWKWHWALVAMTGALALIYIDQTAVAVALPTIGEDLGLSELALQWVINAYLLALAATVAVAGRAGDLYGRRKLFLSGLGVLALVDVHERRVLGVEGERGFEVAHREGDVREQ